MQVLAPVLIHIGGCDLRCPPSQGLLYYNKLKAQGKETRYVCGGGGGGLGVCSSPCGGERSAGACVG